MKETEVLPTKLPTVNLHRLFLVGLIAPILFDLTSSGGMRVPFYFWTVAIICFGFAAFNSRYFFPLSLTGTFCFLAGTWAAHHGPLPNQARHELLAAYALLATATLQCCC